MVNKDIFANPAPLGLMGFGMTTVLLNLHNAGLFELGSMILAMGIFYGGLAQIFAGILEFKKGNRGPQLRDNKSKGKNTGNRNSI